MKPGQYLHHRRTIAGITLGEAARQLIAMQFGHQPLSRKSVLVSLGAAERSESHLSLAQAQVLQNVFPFDPNVYDQLVDRDLADEATAAQMPLPQLCRTCACSFFDPCFETGGKMSADGAISFRFEEEEPCHWAEMDLCSRCAAEADPAEAKPPILTIIPTGAPN